MPGDSKSHGSWRVGRRVTPDFSHTATESFDTDDPLFSRESCQAGWEYFLNGQLPAFWTRIKRLAKRLVFLRRGCLSEMMRRHHEAIFEQSVRLSGAVLCSPKRVLRIVCRFRPARISFCLGTGLAPGWGSTAILKRRCIRYPSSRLFIRNMCDEGNLGVRPHSARNDPWPFPGAEKYRTLGQAKDRWGSGHAGRGFYEAGPVAYPVEGGCHRCLLRFQRVV